MKKYIGLDELKSIQLSILKNVDSFCRKNNLKYFLAYGTLIGAIRHKGYIPWDDDIDIIMPRPDYEVFIKEFNNFHNYYRVIDSSLNKEYLLPFAKVFDNRTEMHETLYKQANFGVYIDVFPLDGCERKSLIKTMRFYSSLLNTKKAVLGQSRGLFKDMVILIGKIILLPFPTSLILKKYKSLAKKTSYHNSKTVNSLFSPYNKKEACEKHLLAELIDCKFEDGYYRIPKNYDKYLRNIYGDYMTPPPIDKQVSHHVYKAWWKE